MLHINQQAEEAAATIAQAALQTEMAMSGAMANMLPSLRRSMPDTSGALVVMFGRKGDLIGNYNLPHGPSTLQTKPAM